MIDINKVNRRFKAHYYTRGSMEQCFHPPEFLLSGGFRPTKIRPEDLPPWYVPITYWNTRYVDTSRVSDFSYRPCRLPHHNHLFKDDGLYIAYDGDRLSLDANGFPCLGRWESLWGWELVDGLFSIREFSGLDIEPALVTLRAKILRYNEEYDEVWKNPEMPYDPDSVFARAQQRVKERKDAYETLHPGAYRA